MTTFKELELIAPLQRALDTENYKTPTPIQAQAIPAALRGRDVLGCAQTGTGKTAAFALPILDWLGELDCKAIPNRPAALVLAPTRELAIQIGDSFDTYGRHLRTSVALVFGGVSQVNQVRSLNRGAHIVVATPGRLLDLLDQNHLNFKFLKRFVLDEADQMLNMGFLPDLRKIIDRLPARRQSMFFSATLPPKILDLSRRLLRAPLHIDVTPKTTSVKKIKQQVMFVEKRGKLSLLKKILDRPDVESALVFTRTKRGADVVTRKLKQIGVSSAAIHGNKSQGARVSALEAFRRNDIQVLVATDIAARGIDVDGITHVVNYDMPSEPESYVHRIGRTGRAGAAGIALSFCTSDERSCLSAIEKLIGKKIPVETEFGERNKVDVLGQCRDSESRGRSVNSGRPVRSDRQRTESRRKSQRPSENKSGKLVRSRRQKDALSENAAPRGVYFLSEDNLDSSNSPDQNKKPKRNKRRRRRKASLQAVSE